MALLKVLQSIYDTDSRQGFEPGVRELPDELAKTALAKGWARELGEGESPPNVGAPIAGDMTGSSGETGGAPVQTEGPEGVTLESENMALQQHLKPLSAEQRVAFWANYPDAELNEFLRARFGVEVKERPRGTIENMIESRLELG